MDCREAQDLLLRGDDPRPERCGIPTLTAHLRACGACSALAADLARVEQAWRDQPLPAECHRARDAFLQRLPALVAARYRPRPWLHPRVIGWAVAAAILLAAGLCTWVAWPEPELDAPDVVDRLIDWNLDLVQTGSLEERNRIYTAQAPRFEEEIRRAPLSPEDRELSQTLLENGTWLASHDDPIDEAERFTAVADTLLTRVNSAAGGGNAPEARRLTQQYCRVTERGVHAPLQRLPKAPLPPNFDHKIHLKKLFSRTDNHARAWESLMKRAPKGALPDFRRAFEAARKPFVRPKGPPPRWPGK